MHPAVERLTALVPPPESRRSRDWPTAEQQLCTPLPADYRQLVDAYGGGVFDETIWLLDPACPDNDYNLLAATTERTEVLTRLWKAETIPDQLRTPGARAIPWAYVEDSGSYLYWLAHPGQKPDAWTVMLNEGRGPRWEPHHTTCAPFLLAVLTGHADTGCFPDLPTNQHQFRSNDDILEQTPRAANPAHITEQ
ncbi:SMI1/KNR4 family protein [Streptomyces sp. C10-9-1]|uniref:SMI1/KNR4 family protein n=1 Tax=Streptomyces sp. C10-9-1 TaxID=1859285 RepID=UPI003D72A46F